MEPSNTYCIERISPANSRPPTHEDTGYMVMNSLVKREHRVLSRIAVSSTFGLPGVEDILKRFKTKRQRFFHKGKASREDADG
ncbi:MAG: hypothetical protein ACLPX5_00150 [Dissulfurispiraceae bacterium]